MWTRTHCTFPTSLSYLYTRLTPPVYRRVGFVELSRDADFTLPCDVNRLNSRWEVQEKSIVAPQFDFVWSLSAEEGREKQLAQHAFTTNLPEMPPVAEYSEKALFVADSAMKVRLTKWDALY